MIANGARIALVNRDAEALHKATTDLGGSSENLLFLTADDPVGKDVALYV